MNGSDTSTSLLTPGLPTDSGMNVTHPITLSQDIVDYGIFRPSEYFVTNQVREITEIVIDFCLSFVVAITGVVLNIIIIIVFSYQGFRDTVNISMTFMAVWDLIKSIAGTLQRMAGPISVFSVADAKSWTNAGVVVFNYVICDSSYVSSALAAYVAFERCLCVSIPFKVKLILTPRFTFIVCFAISVVVFGAFSVVFGFYDIIWVYHPFYNTTVLEYKFSDFNKDNQGPLFQYYNLSGICWPLFSFVVIVVCTMIIVYHLRKSAKFRAGNMSKDSESANPLSARDRQVVKMLLMIIAVYVINLSPRIIHYMVKYFIYDFYFLRKYHNLFLTVCYYLTFFDLFNGAVNFFIFYSMSSSFKTTFNKLFPFCAPQSKK